MNQWILDTDHVSLLLKGNIGVTEQVLKKQSNIAITIITVQEMYNGWIGRINRTADPDILVRLYARLSATVEFIQAVQVLPFNESAKQQYITLRDQNKVLARKRIEKDVRIAAIALSQKATMVTRNKRDFELVSSLRLENWVDAQQ